NLMSDVLSKPPNHVTKEERDQAKVKRRIENIKARNDTIENPTAASSGGETGGRGGGERIGLGLKGLGDVLGGGG
ncbi:hypothetical protein NSK_005214, partial [Nannochloropsis salina CCMP1776]